MSLRTGNCKGIVKLLELLSLGTSAEPSKQNTEDDSNKTLKTVQHVHAEICVSHVAELSSIHVIAENNSDLDRMKTLH